MEEQVWVEKIMRDFPGGPVVKNPPCIAGEAGLTPGQGTKIPHAAEQPGPLATTREPRCHNYWAHKSRLERPCTLTKIPHATTKAWHSQVNILETKRER